MTKRKTPVKQNNAGPSLTPEQLAQAEIAAQVASVQPQVILELERALAEARAGQLVGLGMVKCMGPDQMAVAIAGLHPSTIVCGCEKVKANIIAAMFAPQQSPIIRPPMM